MIVYIYELGLMKSGYVKDISEEDLKDYISVGNYDLRTIEHDLSETSRIIKAYVKGERNGIHEI